MISLNSKTMIGLSMVLFLWMTSCSTKDKDNSTVPGGPATIKINLIGDSYDEDTPDVKAGARSMDVERTTIMIDPSTYVNIEAVADDTPKTRAVKARFTGLLRVVAYDNMDGGKYKGHADYTIVNGVPFSGNSLLLDGGVSYTMIAYATEQGGTLQQLTNHGLLSNASLLYDYNTGKDLMYFIDGNFIPEGGYNQDNPKENTLNILLKHKVALVTAILKAEGEGIKGVKDVIITPNDRYGQFKLSDGTFAWTNTLVGIIPGVAFNSASGSNSVSLPILINGDTGGGKTGTFAATIDMGGQNRPIKTDPFFSIARGKKKNLNINFNIAAGGCKVKVGEYTYAIFACHNLGANTSADPFTPSKEIHGAKFKWGAVIGETGHYLTQEQDQTYSNAPPGNIWGWDNYPLINEAGWTAKSNPCPEGYRVPTHQEWRNVYKYNTWVTVGGTQNGSYLSGWLVHDPADKNNKMFLPAAGYRYSGGGKKTALGYYGSYWADGLYAGYYGNKIDIFNDVHSKGSINDGNSVPYLGYSVRCIKK